MNKHLLRLFIWPQAQRTACAPLAFLSTANLFFVCFLFFAWYFSLSAKKYTPKLFNSMVEVNGIEPMTPCLQSRCSPSWATPPCISFPKQWWVWMGSNHRPPPYQDGALTNWATDPNPFSCSGPWPLADKLWQTEGPLDAFSASWCFCILLKNKPISVDTWTK